MTHLSHDELFLTKMEVRMFDTKQVNLIIANKSNDIGKF